MGAGTGSAARRTAVVEARTAEAAMAEGTAGADREPERRLGGEMNQLGD